MYTLPNAASHVVQASAHSIMACSHWAFDECGVLVVQCTILTRCQELISHSSGAGSPRKEFEHGCLLIHVTSLGSLLCVSISFPIIPQIILDENHIGLHFTPLTPLKLLSLNIAVIPAGAEGQEVWEQRDIYQNVEGMSAKLSYCKLSSFKSQSNRR